MNAREALNRARVKFRVYSEHNEAGYPVALVGYAVITGPGGSYAVRNRLEYRPIHRAVAGQAWSRLRDQVAVSGVSSDRLYEIGFFSKFARWVAKTAKKIAQSKLIKGLVKGVKAVLRSPVIAGMVGLAKFIPVIGPVLNEGYKTATGALNKFDRVVANAQRGNRAARQIVSAVAQSAKRGNPNAINLAARASSALSPGA